MAQFDAAADQVLTLGAVTLSFVDVGDRCAQVALHGEAPLFDSCEGTADDPWPLSPPLQQLHWEDRADGVRLALLVGMAGSSHWSLSVEQRPAEQLLLFDAACRIKTALPAEDASERFPLGSSYRVHAPVEEIRPGVARFAHGDALFEVEALPVEQAPAGRLTVGFDAWRVEPAAWLEGPLPRTLRWRYSLRQIG